MPKPRYTTGRDGFGGDDDDALLEMQSQAMALGAQQETERQLDGLSKKAERLGYAVIPREEFERATALLANEGSAVIESVGVRYTHTGIQFTKPITSDQWLQIVESVASIRQAWQWMIGDLAVYATATFEWGTKGDFYEQLAKTLEIKPQNIHDWASVCRRVNFSERSEKLSFMHHDRVASLPAELQRQFLLWAEQNKLSVRELELAVNFYSQQNRLSDDLLLMIRKGRQKPNKLETIAQSAITLRAKILQEATKKKNRREYIAFIEQQITEWERLKQDLEK